MKIIIYIFLLSFTFGFSQNTFEGYILQENKNPLPFATIRILSNNTYTITNEDVRIASLSTKYVVEDSQGRTINGIVAYFTRS